MQLTTVSRLCSLFLVQCILTTCVQTAPAITAKLIRDIQKRQSEENGTKNDSEQTAVVIHDYIKTVLLNRPFWRRRRCDLNFHCAPVAWQHCTDQIGRVVRQKALREHSAEPSFVCDLDFPIYIYDMDNVTGLEISLYIRTDVMDPSLDYHLVLIQKDDTPQVITNRTLDPNCKGWQTFRYIPGIKDTHPVELNKGDNKITIFLALFTIEEKNNSIPALQTCADIKKLIYLDQNDVNFFSYIQSKTAQSENRTRREVADSDPTKKEKVTDSITSSSKPTDTTSAPTTKPMDANKESLPTTEPSTKPSTSTAENLSNTMKSITESPSSTAENLSNTTKSITESPSSTTESITESLSNTTKNITESPSSTTENVTESPSNTTKNITESPSSTTESLLSTTESTTEAATTETIPVSPVLTEEESFLPLITVFIDRPFTV